MKPKEHFHGSDLEKIEQFYGIKKEDIISFSANVNPLGVSFRLKETLTEHLDAITTYPDREYSSLRHCIAEYVHTDFDNIVVGNGSTELISLFIQITHPKKALIVGPTYSEYEREVALGGGRSHYFSLTEASEFELDIPALTDELAHDVDLLVLCNPNNPTSSIIARDCMRDILDYCKRKSITVLVDETYVEFAENSDSVTAVPLTEYYNNIIILRGISKFFAAPGLRLGYAICGNRDLLKEINRKKNPWTINSLAAIAGEIMFTDEDYIQRTRTLISAERKRVCKALSACGSYKVFEPHANFALVKILKENLTSEDIFDTAIRKGLMIRDCSTFPFLNNKYFRLCFMLPEQNDALLETLLPDHPCRS
jgi:threonine-phosphate decarboxylase